MRSLLRAILVAAVSLLPRSALAQANATISITSPAAGALITRSPAIVTGTLTSPPVGVGVTVNGQPALVDGSQWALLLPVDNQVTGITATARDASAVELDRSTIAVTVNIPIDAPNALLRTIPAGGTAPLVVGFELRTELPVTRVRLSLFGDDFIDFDAPSLVGQLFVYDTPGIYTPTVEVTDLAMRIYNVPALIHVVTLQSLDAALQAVWNGLKGALRSADRQQAANFIHLDVRDDYLGNFNELPDVALRNIDQYFTSIELVTVASGSAKYEMMVGGFSYAILFAIDQDGLWRIWQL